MLFHKIQINFKIISYITYDPMQLNLNKIFYDKLVRLMMCVHNSVTISIIVIFAFATNGYNNTNDCITNTTFYVKIVFCSAS